MNNSPFRGIVAAVSGVASTIVLVLGAALFALVGSAPQQCAVAGATCAILIACYTVPRMFIEASREFTSTEKAR